MRPKKLVHGVGINDIDMPVKGCPYYDRWVGMLRRCYSKLWHDKNPCYIGCSVDEKWRLFSSFKNWMQTQDWKGNVLDKDLLGNGIVYSEDNCCFISQHVNKFIKQQSSFSFSKLIGVHKSKSGRYEARVKDFRVNKLIHIGTFDDEVSAHSAWVDAKAEIIKEMCLSVTDERIKKALEVIYVR